MNKPVLDPTLPERGRQAWKNAAHEAREEALKHATDFLDTLPFKGERLSSTQGLSWPRSGVFRDDGSPVTGVPVEIQEATYLVAGFVLAEVPFAAPAMGHVFETIGHLIRDGASHVHGKISSH